VRRVAGPRHHLDPRIVEAPRELLGVGARHQAIGLAPHQQRRRADAVDALLQALVGNRPDELAGRPHRPGQPGPRERPFLGVLGHREHRAGGGAVGLVEHVGRHLGRPQQHPVHDRGGLEPEADGIEEREAADPRRTQRGHLARHHRPEGMADQHQPLELQRFQQLVVAEDEIPEGVDLLDRLRLAR